MQLMWVSGPTGNVRKVSITAKKMLIGISVVATALVTLGFLLYLVGFKIAIEVRPELARSLGGITTQAEQQRMESVYRERLAKLQGDLESTAQHVRHLETLKNQFMDLATPASVKERRSTPEDGKGGPMLPTMRSLSLTAQPLDATFDAVVHEFGQFHKTVGSLPDNWSRELNRLRTFPTGMPLAGGFRLSSGFGMRTDPFTGMLGRHDGLDFTSAIGAPILATADGVVSRSGWEDTYGNIVEITHAEGFMTRYAHISTRHVTEGQRVKRGDRIAEVGSTGRSTGPHLHYEVFHQGHVINPLQVLPHLGGDKILVTAK
jgi:murein DD-endopeptidase MepM/ murein hydrolase activator NlpD